MDNQTKKDYEIDLLKLEYQECQRGYNQRDHMVEDEFCKVVQLFLLLVATVFLFDRFAIVGRYAHWVGCIILGIAGLFCFFSMLVSIESNASCNVALRRRCREIEKRLHELAGYEIRYWKTINERARHLEEMVFKGSWGTKVGREQSERERNIFINTVRLLIVLWIIVIAIAIVAKTTRQKEATSPNSSVSVTSRN